MRTRLLLPCFFGLALLLALPACHGPEVKQTQTLYFDLDGYFKAEAAKLQQKNQQIIKSVSQNGEMQKKIVRVNNWLTEFDLFRQSDINKPAWRGNYSELKNGGFVVYSAKDAKLRTQKVIVKKEGNKISYIVIANATHSFLYTSRERLTYYPDSLYRIEKNQQIRVIGGNKYRVEGLIKPEN